MAAEEIEMLFQNAPVIILEAATLIYGYIFSTEMIVIDDLLVPVIYKDFQTMFRWAVFLLFFAQLVSAFVLTIDRECIVTKVFRWLGIVFFALALCIFFIYVDFSADI